MQLRKNTIEIFERCYITSPWDYDDMVFLSKKYNWKKYQEWCKQKEAYDGNN
jgi:hypothetical protein